VIPDGLEPSSPGCEPGIFAAGLRDQTKKWTHRESHPNPRFAGPMSSCWTMSPMVWFASSGSRGTRTLKRVALAACFQDRFLNHSDDFRNRQAAGVGIEPTPPGSEPSVTASSNYPAMNARRMTRCPSRSSRIAGAGIEPTDSWFKATNFYQQKLPRIERSDGWDSNPRTDA
jgi:hypothetical protein